MTLSHKLREEFSAHWRRNERPIGLLLLHSNILKQLANEYGSEDPSLVHWLIYGLVPVVDDTLPKPWKFQVVKWKPGKKNEELLASVQR